MGRSGSGKELDVPTSSFSGRASSFAAMAGGAASGDPLGGSLARAASIDRSASVRGLLRRVGSTRALPQAGEVIPLLSAASTGRAQTLEATFDAAVLEMEQEQTGAPGEQKDARAKPSPPRRSSFPSSSSGGQAKRSWGWYAAVLAALAVGLLYWGSDRLAHTGRAAQVALQSPGAGQKHMAGGSGSGSSQTSGQAGQQQQQRPRQGGAGPQRLLSYLPCPIGITHQRLALLSAVVLAAETRRTLVLPTFVVGHQPAATTAVDQQKLQQQEQKQQGSRMGVRKLAAGIAGAQGRGAGSRSGESPAPFSHLFDEQRFIDKMAAAGITVLPAHVAEQRRRAQRWSVRALQWPGRQPTGSGELDHSSHTAAFALLEQAKAAEELQVSCPLFRTPPELAVRHEAAVLAAWEALRPSARLMAGLRAAEEHLRSLSHAGAYNVLHLRLETDWLAACPSQGLAAPYHNCVNHTQEVEQRLRLHGVDSSLPLLVATAWPLAEGSPLLAPALKSLADEGYTAVTWEQMMAAKPGAVPADLGREEAAVVHFELALRAHQFGGNSASTFSALALMQRRAAGRHACHYNAGGVPLEHYLPLLRLPFAFPFAKSLDESQREQHRQAVKHMVQSAASRGRLELYALFEGSSQSGMYEWLRAQNVSLLPYTPTWESDLMPALKARDPSWTDEALLLAYQAVGLALMPELQQYTYLLYSDVDVQFKSQLRLADWGPQLPEAVRLGSAAAPPRRTGLLLLNLPELQRTHKAFVQWVLDQKGNAPAARDAFVGFYNSQVLGYQTMASDAAKSIVTLKD